MRGVIRLWGMLAVAAHGSVEAAGRVRGTIIAVTPGHLIVRTGEGRQRLIKTGTRTRYAVVVPSAVGAIRQGSFVGAAIRGDAGAATAVELALIPKDMRAGRQPLYAWDPLPDSTSTPPGKRVNTRMTNGLVKAVAAVGDGRLLDVRGGGGRVRLRMSVPSTAPVVLYRSASPSAAVAGAQVMIKLEPDRRAGLVTVGQGVRPPM